LTAFARELSSGNLSFLQSIKDNSSMLTPDAQLNYLVERVRLANILPPDADLLQLQRLYQVFQANIRAWQSYQPQLYNGQITFFRANNSNNVTGYDYGWSGIAAVESYELPGDHYSIMSEPGIEMLAEVLKDLFAINQLRISSHKSEL
jgi:thioesterase domain-containing protein